MSFILFIKHITAAGDRSRPLFIFGSWIFFIPAVLSKEIALTLPGVLVLYSVCFVSGPQRKKSLIKIVPYGIIIFVYFWFLYSFIRPVEFLPAKIASHGDIGPNLLTVIKTIGCYLKMLLIPFPLNAEHVFTIPSSLLTPSVLIPLISLPLICAVAVRTYQHSPVIFFALGWIVLTLLPAANIVYLAGRPIAEQRLYIPSFGFCLLLAYGFKEFFRIRSRKQHAFQLITTSCLLIIIIVCLYTAITVFRNCDWRDGITLYSKTLERNPNSARIHYNLGTELNLIGRYIEAINSYQTALYLKPNFAEAHYNLGVSLLNLGRCEETLNYFQAALRIRPDYAEVYCNLGVSFFMLRRYEEAISHYHTALGLKANYAKANYNLGICLFTIGRYEEAISHYQTVLRLDPDDIDAHYNLGLAFYETERYEEAISHYQTALRIKPGQVDVLNNLGFALKAGQHYHEARMVFSTVLEINPDHAQARSGYEFCNK